MFTLQTLLACEEPLDHGLGKAAGFSLNAGVAARADELQKLERLFRYISRRAIAEQRVPLMGRTPFTSPLKWRVLLP